MEILIAYAPASLHQCAKRITPSGLYFGAIFLYIYGTRCVSCLLSSYRCSSRHKSARKLFTLFRATYPSRVYSALHTSATYTRVYMFDGCSLSRPNRITFEQARKRLLFGRALNFSWRRDRRGRVRENSPSIMHPPGKHPLSSRARVVSPFRAFPIAKCLGKSQRSRARFLAEIANRRRRSEIDHFHIS